MSTSTRKRLGPDRVEVCDRIVLIVAVIVVTVVVSGVVVVVLSLPLLLPLQLPAHVTSSEASRRLECTGRTAVEQVTHMSNIAAYFW